MLAMQSAELTSLPKITLFADGFWLADADLL
jgi:hypothetical protein